MEKSDRDAERKMRTAKHFARIKSNATTFVQPHLVAIYQDVAAPKVKTVQVGTGFLVLRGDRPVLLTARHVLFGHRGGEEPDERMIFVNGALHSIGQLSQPQIFGCADWDIAAIYADEFGPDKCLSIRDLSPAEAKPKGVTIQGFLARDFKREASTGMLRPSPWIYTNSRKDYKSGFIALRYPKSRNRSTDTGKKVMAPRPSGVSGGPMLDADMLAVGQINVIGLFTDYVREQGFAYGECSTKAVALLNGM